MKSPQTGVPNHSQKELRHKTIKSVDIGPLVLIVLFGLMILRWFWRRRSGRWVNESGYVLRKTQSGQFQYEHRMLAEAVLGRQLEAWEVVHHINGRRRDNRLSNLCVMHHINHDRYHEWYDWIFETYGNYPRRETQLQKLRESFDGKILSDIIEKEEETN